ncbi:TetR/AcrR family transcriptional regulator [Aliiroseovarius sp. 2305UL8-7]|uniref:TetR/AcrR family transcriptional regulator n=1 Tax=Aliiroseovarius conchicola TaxID=3121637 RepID=UPI003528D656
MTERLTKDAWIAHGFDVLRGPGHEMLKADTMCKSLDVSRGSFYWHFSSLKHFQSALLNAWRTQNTEDVIAELQAMSNTDEQLAALLQKTIDTPQPLERGMRRWGGANKDVARALAEVDRIRADYLTALLLEHGLSKSAASDRSVLLTWAFVGRAFATGLLDDLSDGFAVDIATLLETANPD